MIAIANQKGGVGKTTVTVNLGVALAEVGRRVLLIDLDPQASLTLSLGQDPDAQERAIYDALVAAADGEPTPLGKITIRAGDVDLIPSNIGLSVADVELSGPLGAFALRDALETLPARYDYVLIDCPPNLGVLTLSALLAAGEVLIPLSADYLSTRGLVLLTDQIHKVQRVNPSLRILGVLLTQADFRTLHTRDVVASVQALGKSGRLPVFEAIIPRTVKIMDAAAAGESVLDHAPDNPAAQAFRDLAQEVEGQHPGSVEGAG
jgi:chromosome partitioning protein